MQLSEAAFKFTGKKIGKGILVAIALFVSGLLIEPLINTTAASKSLGGYFVART